MCNVSIVPVQGAEWLVLASSGPHQDSVCNIRVDFDYIGNHLFHEMHSGMHNRNIRIMPVPTTQPQRLTQKVIIIL